MSKEKQRMRDDLPNPDVKPIDVPLRNAFDARWCKKEDEKRLQARSDEMGKLMALKMEQLKCLDRQNQRDHEGRENQRAFEDKQRQRDFEERKSQHEYDDNQKRRDHEQRENELTRKDHQKQRDHEERESQRTRDGAEKQRLHELELLRQNRELELLRYNRELELLRYNRELELLRQNRGTPSVSPALSQDTISAYMREHAASPAAFAVAAQDNISVAFGDLRAVQDSTPNGIYRNEVVVYSVETRQSVRKIVAKMENGHPKVALKKILKDPSFNMP